MADEPNDKLNITDIPPELLLKIFGLLPPIRSVCLGLTCRRFYAIHYITHGIVPLKTQEPASICNQHFPNTGHLLATPQPETINPEDPSLGKLLEKGWLGDGHAYNHRTFKFVTRKRMGKLERKWEKWRVVEQRIDGERIARDLGWMSNYGYGRYVRKLWSDTSSDTEEDMDGDWQSDEDGEDRCGTWEDEGGENDFASLQSGYAERSSGFILENVVEEHGDVGGEAGSGEADDKFDLKEIIN
ncbi:hypothetical protein B0O99DRAFT_588274 [Bisporella sp. PMI_857]|nr:hypothetical protein B0O99DRAFT_588274 [Bisporella sp. PMI_857]